MQRFQCRGPSFAARSRDITPGALAHVQISSVLMLVWKDHYARSNCRSNISKPIRCARQAILEWMRYILHTRRVGLTGNRTLICTATVAYNFLLDASCCIGKNPRIMYPTYTAEQQCWSHDSGTTVEMTRKKWPQISENPICAMYKVKNNYPE